MTTQLFTGSSDSERLRRKERREGEEKEGHTNKKEKSSHSGKGVRNATYVRVAALAKHNGMSLPSHVR